MKRALLIIILLLFTLLAAVLAFLNASTVQFNYYLAILELPLALLLLISFALGSLFSLLVCLGMFLTASLERRRLRKQLNLARQEVRNLRDIPIKGPY